ncbi:hypothetical protein PV325_003831 [Microctonus aethiopoides]|nr:hypothetical protein PV325_003831 [Microctonus aethiopoides]
MRIGYIQQRKVLSVKDWGNGNQLRGLGKNKERKKDLQDRLLANDQYHNKCVQISYHGIDDEKDLAFEALKEIYIHQRM